MIFPEHTHWVVMGIGVIAFAGGLVVALARKVPRLGYPLAGVGAVIAFFGWTSFQTVIRLRDHQKVEASVYEELGAPVIRGRGTEIVNDTSRSVYLYEVVYGTADPSITPPVEVPASMRFHTTHTVDYLGPDDEPPKEIQSRSGGETKYWLTWER